MFKTCSSGVFKCAVSVGDHPREKSISVVFRCVGWCCGKVLESQRLSHDPALHYWLLSVIVASRPRFWVHPSSMTSVIVWRSFGQSRNRTVASEKIRNVYFGVFRCVLLLTKMSKSRPQNVPMLITLITIRVLSFFLTFSSSLELPSWHNFKNALVALWTTTMCSSQQPH